MHNERAGDERQKGHFGLRFHAVHTSTPFSNAQGSRRGGEISRRQLKPPFYDYRRRPGPLTVLASLSSSNLLLSISTALAAGTIGRLHGWLHSPSEWIPRPHTIGRPVSQISDGESHRSFHLHTPDGERAVVSGDSRWLSVRCSRGRGEGIIIRGAVGSQGSQPLSPGGCSSRSPCHVLLKDSPSAELGRGRAVLTDGRSRCIV